MAVVSVFPCLDAHGHGGAGVLGNAFAPRGSVKKNEEEVSLGMGIQRGWY